MQKNKCTLRVATYNIWNNIRNDGLGQEERANQILHEIHAIHAIFDWFAGSKREFLS